MKHKGKERAGMTFQAVWNKIRSLFNKEESSLKESIHKEETFQAVLHQQMCRADRSRQDLAMVVFLPTTGWDRDGLLGGLLDSLTGRKRCFDEIGWFERNGIGIVLPDTALEGARTFAEKIVAGLKHKTAEPLEYTLYTYTPEEIRDRNKQEKEKLRRME
ncbi:MAG: hypothetical protein KJ645_03925, partial [Planctomycetes bacterium]|nr:hypothetical protein [Planctomycetota bacterium]